MQIHYMPTGSLRIRLYIKYVKAVKVKLMYFV